VINSSSNPPVVSTPDIVQSFTYDANGNRLSSSQTHPTSSSTSNAPTNGLNVVAGDYGYNLANRLKDMKQGATTIASYRFNAMGHRIAKTIGEGATPTHHYVYDEAGQLVGEYDATGKLVQEVVWLGNTPVATLRPQAGSTATPVAIDVYYIHTDHLNTPRVITRPSDNKRVWEWRSLPFGEAMPNESPEGLPAFTSHLRFPGQEWEAELGLSQNWFRTYDGQTGRYVQSDPIGLRGGLNTFGYVAAQPLKFVDPTGEIIFLPAIPALCLAGGGTAAASTAAGTGIGIGIGAGVGALGLATLMSGDTPVDQRQSDYTAYKKRCEEKPPSNLSPCDLLIWQYDQARDCARLRKEWDDKYWPGRHAQAIADWVRRHEMLLKKFNQQCCVSCK
jgi:RHS repeat-associated protein